MPPQWGHLSLATIDNDPQVIAVDAQYQLVEIYQAGNLMDHGYSAPAVTGYATIHIGWSPAAGRTRSNLSEFKVIHKF